MNTLTGTRTRTITGYVVTMLEYPRLVIERDIDFTECHLRGAFEAADAACRQCRYGEACCWLHRYRGVPAPDSPLEELVEALDTAAAYLGAEVRGMISHDRRCDCDTCEWLRGAKAFLRARRHKQ